MDEKMRRDKQMYRNIKEGLSPADEEQRERRLYEMEGVPDRPEKLLFSSGGMDRTALLYESLSALIRLDHLHADLHPFRQQCAGIAYFGRVRRRAGRYALSDVGGCDRYFPVGLPGNRTGGYPLCHRQSAVQSFCHFSEAEPESER